MQDIPIVRVEFEQMRHSMLTAINQHLDEISQVAEAQLTELLSDQKFLSMVRTQMEMMARNVIAQSVEQALKREMAKHIDDMVAARYKKLWEDLYPPQS